jgi:hypothetical protein
MVAFRSADLQVRGKTPVGGAEVLWWSVVEVGIQDGDLGDLID